MAAPATCVDLVAVDRGRRAAAGFDRARRRLVPREAEADADVRREAVAEIEIIVDVGESDGALQAEVANAVDRAAMAEGRR